MSMLFADMDSVAETEAAPGYRVLARKYRPVSFDQLIGQDVLVRTLTHAIESGRIAQAYMLTGVRGIGKTTTARIIARALNCIGADGQGGPTIHPCGVCANCVAIAQDRHVDVLEMDAASRTGVDDIRDIIDGVRYGPVSARYKIYIIDEVHMLSKNAFNALLKTLEEPPPHTKFIFATTEIRKVPVTVLSRCQRFDLRRVDAETLEKHFKNVVGWEKAEAEDEAIALIARAADGSVRDGLSLLDQAIARSEGKVSADDVKAMLGLADRARVIDLFSAIHEGEPARALEIAADLRALGADALVVLQDLADITHMLTRLKAAPNAGASTAPELEQKLASTLGAKLDMPSLTRSWQMLLKGIQEVQHAADAHKALEMVIIRMSYIADLPPPGDLVKRLQDSGVLNAAGSAAPSGGGGGAKAYSGNAAIALATSQPAARVVAAPAPQDVAAVALMPESFVALVDLFMQKREPVLYAHLYRDTQLVSFQVGKLEIHVKEHAPANLAPRVAQKLQEWTGKFWAVTLSHAPGEASLAEQNEAARIARWNAAASHPLVQSVLKNFTGAKMIDVHKKATQEEAPAEANETVFDDEA